VIIKETKIPGCFEVLPKKLKDNRGWFVKTFHEEIFAKNWLTTDFAEEYYSCSRKGVLRGLHFQIPPHDHIKMVYCVYGEIMDAIVDLRIGSPTFGKHAIFELSAENAKSVYITNGIAHGFYVQSEFAIVIYKVTTVYAPEHDSGIRWNSVDIPWPDKVPIVSHRDSQLPKYSDFKSPFRWK